MEHLEVVIFDEIDDYSEKIKGLTFRQWIFVALAVIVVVPTYLLIPKYTPLTKDIVSYIVILEAAIIGLFGFIKIQNLNAEQIVPFWYRHFMIYKKPIEYITDTEWEKAHEKKNKKSKANKNQNAVGSLGISESNHTNIPTDAKENEVKNSQKQLEQSVVNEGKPPLTKKELKKKQKQEKMLKKAQAKYGYMFSDENGDKSNNETELIKEPVAEEDELITHEVPVEPKEEQVTEDAENLTNVEDNKIDDVFNSLSPEERKTLLKKLVNNE